VGYVASIGERREIYRVLVGKIEGKRPFRVPGVDGRMMFTCRWNFRKWGVRAWTGLIWLRIGTGGGHL